MEVVVAAAAAAGTPKPLRKRKKSWNARIHGGRFVISFLRHYGLIGFPLVEYARTDY